jgi:hypothetical protein
MIGARPRHVDTHGQDAFFRLVYSKFGEVQPSVLEHIINVDFSADHVKIIIFNPVGFSRPAAFDAD